MLFWYIWTENKNHFVSKRMPLLLLIIIIILKTISPLFYDLQEKFTEISINPRETCKTLNSV